MDIHQFMYNFNNQTREPFNPEWFLRSDDDLIEGMKNIILSCQMNKYFTLRVLSFTVYKDYNEINNALYNYYCLNSKKKKGEVNEYEFTNLNDSDIMLLKVNYYIRLNVPPEKIAKDEQAEGEYEILIALPRYVNKYFFRIAGNYYIPIYQIVDGSTYNNTTSTNTKVPAVTLKTNFMYVRIYKEVVDLANNLSSHPVKCTLFTARTFNKKTDAMKFILAKYGMYGALKFLDLQGIFLSDAYTDDIDPNVWYSFGDKVQILVKKYLFDKDMVTQSFVATILKNSKKVESYKELFDARYWVRSLARDIQGGQKNAYNNLDKGISVLNSFEDIYDLSTKSNIRLPSTDKENTYRILRWMLREFDTLARDKSNLDIATKRARFADEYIPALYATKISTSLYRISDEGAGIKFRNIIRAINIDPLYIIKNLHKTHLVEYVNSVTDNDAELALSYTFKGISGVGGDKGFNTVAVASSPVPTVYRSVHPSQLGIVDITSSSNSDPGLTGIICPTAKQYGGFFSEMKEPNEWREFYSQTLNEMNALDKSVCLQCPEEDGASEYEHIKRDITREIIPNQEE